MQGQFISPPFQIQIQPDYDDEHQEELDLAIRLGWGDIPFNELPEDWRTRRRYDPRIKVRF